MRKMLVITLFLALSLLLWCFSVSAAGQADRIAGENFISKSVEISGVSSRRLKEYQHGLSWYYFRAKALNRTRSAISITVEVHGVDQDGRDIKKLAIEDRSIAPGDTITLLDKFTMAEAEYMTIERWKVNRLLVKRLQ